MQLDPHSPTTRSSALCGALDSGQVTPAARSPLISFMRQNVVENLLGGRFIAGFVLYTGQQTLPFGSKIRALPLEALWRVRP